MNPDSVKETYKRMIENHGEWIFLRRYLGSGNNRPKFEAKVRARVFDYTPVELIGTIIQGDVKIILLTEDLETSQFDLPILKNDKVIVKGKEINIESVDKNTKRIQGEIIAYVLQGRG